MQKKKFYFQVPVPKGFDFSKQINFSKNKSLLVFEQREKKKK